MDTYILQTPNTPLSLGRLGRYLRRKTKQCKPNESTIIIIPDEHTENHNVYHDYSLMERRLQCTFKSELLKDWYI